MAFELPALPYDKAALEPHIDAMTMEIHHGRHHNAYVTNLNNAVKGTEMENMSIGVQLEFLEFEKLTDTTSRLTIQIIYKSEEHRAEQLKLPFAYGLSMAHDRLQELFINQH